LPVDDDTLSAWSSLLGLTEKQKAATLADIEQTLRIGYDHRPDAMLDMSFEQLTNDLDTDEAALLFLISGLRQAGHPDAARAVEIRALVAQLQADHKAD
ncbi:hypothetical protein ACWDA8_34550, partial [Streptomyces sp. NPDC001130]